jgi:hypothetical protein
MILTFSTNCFAGRQNHRHPIWNDFQPKESSQRSRLEMDDQLALRNAKGEIWFDFCYLTKKISVF